MALSQIVNGLAAKRGELAGKAEHRRRTLERLAQELGHPDGRSESTGSAACAP